MERNYYFDYVIGRCIQTARQKAKKTKKDIYTRFGIPRKTYDRYEKGESSTPIPLVLDIWMYCGVSSIKDLGEELIKELGNSAYGRTLLKWLPKKND
jgi:transcriptional regulator with XRE-family HTH domain